LLLNRSRVRYTLVQHQTWICLCTPGIAGSFWL